MTRSTKYNTLRKAFLIADAKMMPRSNCRTQRDVVIPPRGVIPLHLYRYELLQNRQVGCLVIGSLWVPFLRSDSHPTPCRIDRRTVFQILAGPEGVLYRRKTLSTR